MVTHGTMVLDHWYPHSDVIGCDFVWPFRVLLHRVQQPAEENYDKLSNGLATTIGKRPQLGFNLMLRHGGRVERRVGVVPPMLLGGLDRSFVEVARFWQRGETPDFGLLPFFCQRTCPWHLLLLNDSYAISSTCLPC